MEPKNYHIIADGFKRIKINSFNPDVYQTPAEMQSPLDTFVQKQIAKAQKRGGLFFDGELIGTDLSRFSVKGEEISIVTQKIKYSQHCFLFRNNPHSTIQALYVNGIVITADNRLIMGSTQATEANWMGKLSLPAGGITVGPTGFPSLSADLYAELSEELFIIPEYHLNGEIIPGWINSGSKREGNYHLTVSFIVPLRLREKELREWFEDCQQAHNKLMASLADTGKQPKTEFKNLVFFPNEEKYFKEFIANQDQKGQEASLLGKTADVLEEGVSQYRCDLETLKSSKNKARIYLPQKEF